MIYPLAHYYPIWYQDCLDSAEYCRARGNDDKAEEYLIKADYWKRKMESAPKVPHNVVNETESK